MMTCKKIILLMLVSGLGSVMTPDTLALTMTNHGASIVVKSGHLIVNGAFSNKQTASGYHGLVKLTGGMAVTGDWKNTATGGVFTPESTGYVKLKGKDQSVEGITYFPNVAKHVDGASCTLTIKHAPDSVLGVRGNLELKGMNGQLLKLRSDLAGNQWNVDVKGTYNFEYLDVQDSNNIGSFVLNVDGKLCVDSGNNTRWIFVAKTHTITTRVTGNGTISPSGSVQVNQGDSQTFHIIPDTGYRIVRVFVDGIDQGVVSQYTFDKVDADHSIHAYFADESKFAIIASAGNGGVINPNGVVVVDKGSRVTFSMIPDSGYEVKDVVMDHVSYGAIDELTFESVQTDHFIHAEFVERTMYLISASSEGYGSLEPTGMVKVYQGDSQTFYAIPDRGYYVGDLVVDQVSQGEMTEYTFEKVGADHSIHAVFYQNPPTIDQVGDMTIEQNSHSQTVELTGITDGGANHSELSVDASTDAPDLIGDLSVSYTSPQATGALSFTPVANMTGHATIDVVVKNLTNPALTCHMSFTVYVLADVSMLKDINPGSAGAEIAYIKSFRGMLFLRADDGIHGSEIWVSNGTVQGTELGKDINPGAAGSYPYKLTPVDTELFFVADDGTHGYELWGTDWEAKTLKLVKDILPGADSSFPNYLTNVNGALFCAASDKTLGIWKSDGTETGTTLVRSLPTDVTDYHYTNSLVGFRGALLFQGDESAYGAELWKSDGTETGTTMLKDIWLGKIGSAPHNLTSDGTTLFFCADDGSSGTQLWRSGGTAATTKIVKKIRTGEGCHPQQLTLCGGQLFYVANNGRNGYELWVSDGTETGTRMVKDIYPGAESSNPSHLTNINGTLFFAADNGTDGCELWKSNGTTIGTKLVKDIFPGSGGSNPKNIAPLGSRACFSADNGVNGRELWKSDGTEAGTILVEDIWPGVEGSDPAWLAEMDGTLYFSADDGVSGRELWRYVPVSTSSNSIKLTVNVLPDGAGAFVDSDTSKSVRSVSAGLSNRFSVDPASGYSFVKWTLVSGAASISTPYDTTTTIIPDSDAVVSAIFAKSEEVATLEIGSDSLNGGTVSPSGAVSLLPGESITISAHAALDYIFIGWDCSDGVVVDKPYAATTTVATTKSGTVTAIFARSDTSSSLNPTFIIKRETKRSDQDSIAINDMAIPADIQSADFSPEQAYVSIDGVIVRCEELAGWRIDTDLATYKSKDSSGKVQLAIDFNKKRWSFKASKMNLAGLDNSNGIDIFLGIGDRSVGGNFIARKRCSWSFNAKSDTSENIGEGTLENFAVLQAKGFYDTLDPSRNQFNIVRGSFSCELSEKFKLETPVFALIDGIGFSIIPIEGESARTTSSQVVHNDKILGDKLVLSPVKRFWSMKLTRNGLSGLSIDDELDLRLEFNGLGAAVRLHPQVKTTLTYPLR